MTSPQISTINKEATLISMLLLLEWQMTVGGAQYLSHDLIVAYTRQDLQFWITIAN